MQRRRQRGGGTYSTGWYAREKEERLNQNRENDLLNTLKSAWEQSVSCRVMSASPTEAVFLIHCNIQTCDESHKVYKKGMCEAVDLRIQCNSGFYKLQTGQRSLHNYSSTLSGIIQIYLVPVLFCLHFPLLPFLSLAFLSLTTFPLIFAYSHPSHLISLPLCLHYFLSNISVCLSYSPPRPVFCVVLDSVAVVNRTSMDTVMTLTALRLFLFLFVHNSFPSLCHLPHLDEGASSANLGGHRDNKTHTLFTQALSIVMSAQLTVSVI